MELPPEADSVYSKRKRYKTQRQNECSNRPDKSLGGQYTTNRSKQKKTKIGKEK
jgi:hypothetical protein